MGYFILTENYLSLTIILNRKKQVIQVLSKTPILKIFGDVPGKNLWPCTFFVKLQTVRKISFYHWSCPRFLQIVVRQLLYGCLEVWIVVKIFESSFMLMLPFKFISIANTLTNFDHHCINLKSDVTLSICFTHFLFLQLPLHLRIRLGYKS